MKKEIWTGWELLIFCLLTLCLGLLVGHGLTSDYFKADAVRKGFAHWVVTSEYGKTNWEWVARKE